MGNINCVKNKLQCTERAYLQNIIKTYNPSTTTTKPYNLRKRENTNNANSDDEESSFNSSLCSTNDHCSEYDQISSEQDDDDDDDDESEESNNASDADSKGDTFETPNVFKCKDCNKTFDRPSLFKEHCKKKHDNLSPFECTLCNPPRRYSSKGNLTVHIRSFHEKIVNYRCKICQKGFFDKAHCQLHETSHYNDNDEYVPIAKYVKKDFLIKRIVNYMKHRIIMTMMNMFQS